MSKITKCYNITFQFLSFKQTWVSALDKVCKGSKSENKGKLSILVLCCLEGKLHSCVYFYDSQTS